MTKIDKLKTEKSASSSSPATEKVCFIICPIGSAGSDQRKRSDNLLTYILEPICAERKIKCVRADQLKDPGIITNQIMDYLVTADLVIADLTDKNPNVFYELGIRHCSGKAFIQIMHDKVDVPFDIGTVRTTAYHLEIDKVEASKKAVGDQIDWIMNNPDKVVNPVTLAVNVGELTKGSATEKLLAQMGKLLASLYRKVEDIESEVSTGIGGFSSLDDVKSAIDDVESKVDDINSKLDMVQNEIRDLDCN